MSPHYFVMVQTGNERKPEAICNGRKLLFSCDNPHSGCIHFLRVGSEEVLLNFFGVIDSYQYS